MKNKILVTGGSGFIGTNLVEYLIDQNIDFINADINPPKIDNHIEYWKKIDIRNEYDVNQLISSFCPSHLINLAADLGMDHSSLDNLQTNIKGVDNIINAINKVKTIKRAIFISSLLVCKNGYIPKSDIDYNPPNFYGKSKVVGEEIVRNGNLNCEWVILRPTSIWGPWFDYSYKEFFITIDKNRYFHLGRDEFQKPASYVGNTVFTIMKMLFSNSKDINKGMFYIADYKWYSTRKWANTIQKVLNSKHIYTASITVLKVFAIIGDLLKVIFKIDPPLTSFRLNNMLTGGKYPINSTKKITGDLPFDLVKSTVLTAKWLYDNKLIKHEPSNYEKTE